MLLGVVEWSQIFEVIWVSLVMGVGVTALYSLIIHGYNRALEARRSGEGPAVGHGAVALVAGLLFAAAVVFGIVVILNKS